MQGFHRRLRAREIVNILFLVAMAVSLVYSAAQAQGFGPGATRAENASEVSLPTGWEDVQDSIGDSNSTQPTLEGGNEDLKNREESEAAPLASTSASVSVPPSFELTCREQAKELATKSYRVCMTEKRSSEIERLRLDFQKKLKDLQQKYEAEIQRLGGKIGPNAPPKKINRESAPPIVDPANTRSSKGKSSTTRGAGERAESSAKSERLPNEARTSSEQTSKGSESRDRSLNLRESNGASPNLAREMRIQLKRIPMPVSQDDSIMDLPDPVPVR